MILESFKVDIPRIFWGVPSVLSDAWSYLKQHEASGDSKRFRAEREGSQPVQIHSESLLPRELASYVFGARTCLPK